ncbi:MAG: helix-turn-helix domain-containing protein [Parasporobacterium sp.]|nr:helix-turn-helix domain-containing protein [Parasporobacterium sp.]
MRLSLDIIRNYLKFPEKPAFFQTFDTQLHLSRPFLYDGQSVLESDTLYICESSRLPVSVRFEAHSALILIGEPGERWKKKAKNLLVFQEGTDLFSLFNQVSRVFDFFDSWEKDLLSIFSEAGAGTLYQAILELSSPVFENGISLMNNNYKIICENETNIRYGGYHHSGPDKDFAILPDIINFFKYDRDYQKIVNEKDVFYYAGDVLPHRVLCKNIFLHGSFAVRIILTECIRPFRSSDEILLEFLSAHFQRVLEQLFFRPNESENNLVRLLTESIETGKVNRKAFKSELHRISWEETQTYRVASIHASSDDLFISTLSYYPAEVMRTFPHTFAFRYQDTILLIINETKAGSLENFSDKLSVFVRENNFRVGISNFAEGLFLFQMMYRQAEMALSIGLGERPMEWIHWFSRYTLDYIFNILINDSDLGQLYSPIYYRLERYDKENGSEYLKTLRVYLECRMNAVQAAKELCIQRSTMIYRLKRIREIADNDLEKGDDVLHLYLTFSIIDRK